jgi:hypothetical protein
MAAWLVASRAVLGSTELVWLCIHISSVANAAGMIYYKHYTKMGDPIYVGIYMFSNDCGA